MDVPFILVGSMPSAKIDEPYAYLSTIFDYIFVRLRFVTQILQDSRLWPT